METHPFDLWFVLFSFSLVNSWFRVGFQRMERILRLEAVLEELAKLPRTKFCSKLWLKRCSKLWHKFCSKLWLKRCSKLWHKLCSKLWLKLCSTKMNLKWFTNKNRATKGNGYFRK
ncbi:hypothetical protein Lal_00027121 [Lupinus albus]|nr:hypothetical protein Lal_00027121 [Lupinus albus]